MYYSVCIFPLNAFVLNRAGETYLFMGLRKYAKLVHVQYVQHCWKYFYAILQQVTCISLIIQLKMQLKAKSGEHPDKV